MGLVEKLIRKRKSSLTPLKVNFSTNAILNVVEPQIRFPQERKDFTFQ